MKMLLVIDGMHPRSGGPPAVVAGSARGLRVRGHDVTVLSTVNAGEEQEVMATWGAMLADGVRLVFVAPQGLGALFGRTQDDTVVQREVSAADVVHLHGLWNPVLVLAGKHARRAGVPYVISVHGVLDHRAIRRIPRKWLKKRLAIELFDLRGLLAHSPSVIFGSEAEIQQSWLPARKLRLNVVPNGAARELGTVAPTDEMMQQLHAVAPACRNWRRTLLCRSRIHEDKGLDMVVEAFNEVAPDFPGAGLLIAGMKQDIAYQHKVEALIAGGPVAERIVLTTELTGPRSQFLYLAADVFLLPSVAEGFSMALIEALANGRPVLITRYCHMPEIEKSGAGVVVDPSADQIAAGLRRLLSLSNTELTAMGANARRLFEENYTWDRVCEQLERTYEEARRCPSISA